MYSCISFRFIGELYKQQILTTKIMHRCVRHLLEQNDEDNLECLCKLLTTIGKDLELKGPAEVKLCCSYYLFSSITCKMFVSKIFVDGNIT